MAEDPVAIAASNNPLLTTLTAAVSGELNPDVNLVDTLNGDEFTVFAPVDAAFAKLPTATVDAAKPEDAETLEHDPDLPRGPRSDRPGRRSSACRRPSQGEDLEVTGPATASRSTTPT